jgi:hypothetical protein
MLALLAIALSSLALLALGLWRRSDALLLAAFPAVTLLPVALLAGGEPEARLASAPPLAVSALSLLGYMIAAAAFGRAREVVTVAVEKRGFESGPLPERWRRRMRVYAALQAAAAAIPLVMLWAVDLRGETRHALERSFGARADAVQVVLTVAAGALSFALWRAFLVGPLEAHLQQDPELVRALQAARKQARRGRPRGGFYLAVAVALAGVAAMIARLL